MLSGPRSSGVGSPWTHRIQPESTSEWASAGISIADCRRESEAGRWIHESRGGSPTGDDDLTARELEVLRLIREGLRNKQIADQLAISENTVNFHIKNLMDKLRANDRTHAVTIALRRGMLQI
jgi:DNA-binding NarL/FixJ family response regulator